jgi:hypothetical protein
MNITKRDVKVFLLGMLAMFILEVAFHLEDSVKGFREGLEGKSETPK